MIQLERSKSALVLLALVVIASGCSHTAGSTTDAATTTAVQVQNFSAIPDTVYESQSPTLRLSLKNTGTVEATNVKAELFNVPFGDRNNREWESDSQKFDFRTLRPANEEAGIPATPKERTLTLTPPDLAEGDTIPYDFMARISYDYETRGDTQIQLMSQSQFRDTGAARSQPTVDNTNGPIQMEVRTRTPIVFYGDGSTSSNLCLIMENEGEGTPYDIDDRESEDVVDISIRNSGDLEFNEVDGDEGAVELVGNRGIKCYSIDVSGFDADSDIQRTIPVTFVAEYGYYKDTQTSVTVKGRNDGGDSGDSEVDGGGSADSGPGIE